MRKPEDNDALWDPELPADSELQHWRQLLAPYAAQRRAALAVAPWVPKPSRLRRPRWALRAMAIAATVLLSLWGALVYRLAWPAGQPWLLTSAQGQQVLAPGERFESAADDSARLAVARIGRLQLAPGSAVRMLDSRSGHHRVELEYGRLHARIWAPPGHFGIRSGPMQVIDLGCEFTLERRPDGSGSLSVSSGWVLQVLGGREQLVPADHEVNFSAEGSGTPLRHDATPALRSALAALDRGLDTAISTEERDQLAAAVAQVARDEDRYTLMALLVREPALASGPLYPRLAQALDLPGDDAVHRAAWLQRDRAAIELWWLRLPSQPKRWWAHWRDAF